jgi:hypothetical protein
MNTETNLDEHNPVNKIEGGGDGICNEGAAIGLSDGYDPVKIEGVDI